MHAINIPNNNVDTYFLHVRNKSHDWIFFVVAQQLVFFAACKMIMFTVTFKRERCLSEENKIRGEVCISGAGLFATLRLWDSNSSSIYKLGNVMIIMLSFVNVLLLFWDGFKGEWSV